MLKMRRIILIIGSLMNIYLFSSCSSTSEARRYTEQELTAYIDSFKISTLEQLSSGYESDLEIRRTIELRKLIDSLNGDLDTFEVVPPEAKEEIIQPSILFDSIP